MDYFSNYDKFEAFIAHQQQQKIASKPPGFVTSQHLFRSLLVEYNPGFLRCKYATCTMCYIGIKHCVSMVSRNVWNEI